MYFKMNYIGKLETEQNKYKQILTSRPLAAQLQWYCMRRHLNLNL